MKFFSKNVRIIEKWVGEKVYVYNGRLFQRKTITASMVGHKLGEFIWTKKLGAVIHQKEKKKKKKRKS